MRALTVVLFSGFLSHAAAAATCTNAPSSWVLCEDFEDGAAGFPGWYDASPFVECLGCDGSQNDPDRIRLTQDPALVHDGTYALEMPGAAAANFEGASLTWRSCAGEQSQGCTLRGYERLFFRAWVRLAPDHAYVHHFMNISGTTADGYWDSEGTAGCRPDGNTHVGSTLDFDEEHALFFYTYTPDMHCDSGNAGGGYCSPDSAFGQNVCDGCAARGMPCDNGIECCWGNLYAPDPRPTLPRGEWVCLEMMMQLNTPGQHDGRMAYWMNETLRHEETGMLFRNSPDVQLNKIWVQHYIADGDTDRPNQIAWDDIVGSTERIGCGSTPPNPASSGPAPASSAMGSVTSSGGVSAQSSSSAGSSSSGGAAANRCACASTTPGFSSGGALLALLAVLRLRRR